MSRQLPAVVTVSETRLLAQAESLLSRSEEELGSELVANVKGTYGERFAEFGVRIAHDLIRAEAMQQLIFAQPMTAELFAHMDGAIAEADCLLSKERSAQ